MDELAKHIDAFARSEWGQATLTQMGASGLCLRATLAFLAQLERAGMAEGCELWNFTGAVEGKGRGPDQYGTHWVLIRGEDLVDVSARQFDPNGPHIRRDLPADEAARWHHHEKVDPDSRRVWNDPFLRARIIHPDWRSLIDVGPPGDLPDWPYPRHRLDEGSPWYRPLVEDAEG